MPLSYIIAPGCRTTHETQKNYDWEPHSRSGKALLVRIEGSGAKQCSGFEEKISKSELCTGTAFESEGSYAKQCVGFEGKQSKNSAQAHPKMYCVDYVLEVKAQVQSSAVVSKER